MLKLLRRVGCLWGAHERSRGQARDDESGLHSVCRFCSAPMTKNGTRWELTEDQP